MKPAPGMKRFDARLTDDDFARFSRLVYDQCGIKLPPHKRSMLEARLRKRLRAHNLHTFEDYAELVFAKGESQRKSWSSSSMSSPPTKRIFSGSRLISITW